ncbi:MAG TPA: class I adenylate-forming enzyme family protein [Acidimicrobiales bacterium]|nr:class I adenylate-forming enzyme family protein [Acidimicrobiales bacterium]
MRTLAEALAAVTAPGQPFETTEVELDGGPVRRFVNAPPTLRDVFAPARGLDQTFLVFEDEEWSFARVMDEVDGLAHALVHHFGIAKGDRVAIAMRNYPEWVVAFAAITSVGAISVSLNAWWTERELAFALSDAGPSVLVADAERVERAAGAARRAGVAVLGVRLGAGAPAGVERWEEVVVPGRKMPVVDLEPDDDATILYTSGTTGFPKGAVSTHRAICQALMAFASGGSVQEARRDGPPSEGEPSGPQCFILIVPLFHVTGCVPVMLSCFLWHFKLVMMYKWDAERALGLIERHRVTSFVGVPTQSWDLMEAPGFASYDTSSLRSIGGGGAPAPPTLVERVERSFRGRPNLGYGMTESNAYGPGNYGEEYVTHPASTGRVPTIVTDVEIRDATGRALGAGERGEIWLRSPTLIRGYWNDPAATAEAIQHGWLRTGDLGRIDDEGFLYVEDRAKDMILRGGENVYSAEVESAIYEHPAVYEAAVVGLAHERLGEEVGAVVRVRDGEDLDVEGLRTFLAERLAPYMVPTRIALTHEPLPRNPAGKFVKREMRTRYFDATA